MMSKAQDGSARTQDILASLLYSGRKFHIQSMVLTLECLRLLAAHLITDSSGDVAHLHPARLSDADAPPVEVADADIHP